MLSPTISCFRVFKAQCSQTKKAKMTEDGDVGDSNVTIEIAEASESENEQEVSETANYNQRKVILNFVSLLVKLTLSSFNV
jgi:hypothetical protein